MSNSRAIGCCIFGLVILSSDIFQAVCSLEAAKSTVPAVMPLKMSNKLASGEVGSGLGGSEKMPANALARESYEPKGQIPVPRKLNWPELWREPTQGKVEAVPPAIAGEGRTFGHKRIQFMLMPLMYKMGVMMTLLTVLTVISLKGLLIGIILLILKLSTIIGKFSSGWHQTGWHASSPSAPHSAQPVHLHVHSSFPHGHATHPYHGWISDAPSEKLAGLVDHSEDESHYYYKG